MAAASGDACAGAVIVPRYGSYSLVQALTASNTASSVMAANRACANGFCALIVCSMFSVQSWTASAREGVALRSSKNATAGRVIVRLTLHLHPGLRARG